MSRDYVHFASFTKPKAKEPRSAEEFAELIESKIRDMQEDGEKYGEIRIELPDDLTEDEARLFIQEIMKRLGADDE